MIDENAMHHLQKFIIIDWVWKCPCDFLKLLKVQDSVFCWIKVIKYDFESFFSFDISKLRANQIQKLIKIDGFSFGGESLDYSDDERVPVLSAKFL